MGQSGVGRRNAVSLMTYALGYRLYTPAITRDYALKHFINDVKVVLEVAGVQGQHIVLLIEDFQITQEAILETLNSLISAGEAPGIYTHEELEPILGQIRKLMMNAEDDEDGADGHAPASDNNASSNGGNSGGGSSKKTPYEVFLQRIRRYLHVVLVMDARHPQFLYRGEANPALYAQCKVRHAG